jgi:alkaline phosphatase D
MRRREFLRLGAGGIGAAALGTAAACTPLPGPPEPTTTFSLGVASGLHSPTEVVLWTRVEPLIAPGVASVDWEVATSPSFGTVVASGTVPVSPANDSTVKVLVGGLSPGTTYWYRFTTGGEDSPVGRTRTLPAPGAPTGELRLAFASCQAYGCGFYANWRHIAAADLDAVLFLGDYIYEAGTIQLLGRVRDEPLEEVTDLAGYRSRYRLYRSDPDLQAAHAAHPFAYTWDDHEIVNDYDSLIFVEDPVRAAEAYQAWFEYQPVWPSVGTRIYRDFRWGDLAHIAMIDTRQYRDPHSPGAPLIGLRALGAYEAAVGRTMLGEAQRTWLLDALTQAELDGVPWKLIGNPTMIAPIRVLDLDTPELRALDPNILRHAGLYTNANFDSWDGFPWERDLVLGELHVRGIQNTSFLSGDYHSFWQQTLTTDFDDPSAPQVANDFATGAISSAGGANAENLLYGGPPTTFPPFRYVDTFHNGYGLVRCTPGEMTVTYLANDAAYRDALPVPRVRFTLTPGDPVPTTELL